MIQGGAPCIIVTVTGKSRKHPLTCAYPSSLIVKSRSKFIGFPSPYTLYVSKDVEPGGICAIISQA